MTVHLGKLLSLDVSQALNGVGGLNNSRVEVFEILVPSKAQMYECLFSQ